MTNSFWWWLPSRRTRSSSRTSPPASFTVSTRWRFSCSLKCAWSACDRHTRPRTWTPRSAQAGEHAGDLGARPVEALVGIAPPVGEVDPVVRRAAAQTRGSRAKYSRRGPARGRRCPRCSASRRRRRRSISVAGLPRSAGRQEPVGGRHAKWPAPTGARRNGKRRAGHSSRLVAVAGETGAMLDPMAIEDPSAYRERRPPAELADHVANLWVREVPPADAGHGSRPARRQR